MDPEIDALVLLFAEKLRIDGMLTQPPASGDRRLVVQHRGHQLDVLLPEGALRKLLADGDELAADLWGPNVSAMEAAARILTVHLDESLDTAPEGSLEGTWTYDGGFFTRS